MVHEKVADAIVKEYPVAQIRNFLDAFIGKGPSGSAMGDGCGNGCGGGCGNRCSLPLDKDKRLRITVAEIAAARADPKGLKEALAKRGIKY